LTIAWLLRAGSIADLDVAAIAEIVEATAWQQQAIHEASAGALKKNPGLTIVSEKAEGRCRVYQIKRKRNHYSAGASL
jgi:hypothetical protein